MFFLLSGGDEGSPQGSPKLRALTVFLERHVDQEAGLRSARALGPGVPASRLAPFR